MSVHVCETKQRRFVEIKSVEYIKESAMYSIHREVKLQMKTPTAEL